MSDGPIDDDTQNRLLQTFTVGLTAYAAVTWAFIQPLIAYADPDWLATFGYVLATGIALTYLGIAVQKIPAFVAVIGGAIAFAAMLGLAWVMILAGTKADGTAELCSRVQADMLSPHPSRTDAPAIFAALKCSPQ
jgi:hypothetical protein